MTVVLPARPDGASAVPGPLPLTPCLRRDAALLAGPGQRVRLILSSRRTVEIEHAPPGLVDWLYRIDGTRPATEVIARSPLPAADARVLLGELGRAGLLIEWRSAADSRTPAVVQQDALAAASQCRAGALQRQSPTVIAVWLDGPPRWTGPLQAALADCGSLLGPAAGPTEASLLVVIDDALALSKRDPCAAAMAQGCPHLVVEVSAVDAVLSPLVLPGQTGCRRCWALHADRRAADWGAWTFGGSAPRAPELPAHHRALVLSLAVEHVLAAADILTGRLDPERGSWESHLDLRTCSVARRAFPAHPACGCTGPALRQQR